MHYTAIVIGGGPAGSAAAYTLARRGISVCLIDKAIFPREKLCGGLLSLRSKKLFHQIFDADWEKTYNYTSAGIHFMTPDRYLNGTDSYRDFYLTYRLSFDDYLLRLAREAGALVKEGDSLFYLSPEKNSLSLRSGETFTFDYLIGADGVNSTVAKTLFGESFRKDKIAFALEVETKKELLNRELKQPEIYFNNLKWGYGWVFPKADSYTIGICGLHTLNPDMKSDMQAFFQSLTGKADPGKVKGHYLPWGHFKRKPGRKNILLAGDAAGFVDSLSGEGIAYAMQSGYLAAQAITESIDSASPENALRLYRKKVKGIMHDIRIANRLRPLIYSSLFRPLFVRLLPKSRQLVQHHIDLLADDLSYGQYARFILRKAGQTLLQKLSGK